MNLRNKHLHLQDLSFILLKKGLFLVSLPLCNLILTVRDDLQVFHAHLTCMDVALERIMN